jgi:hypothetical protein
MWLYKGEVIGSIEQMPENMFGFVYEVTYIPTNEKYLGKKVLYFERNKRLGKKALETLRLERKSKGLRGKTPSKQKTTTESDWLNYLGSHNRIKQLILEGKSNQFSKKILEFAFDKKHLTYLETKYQFCNQVLENTEYINDNILGKFFRKDLVKPNP